MPYPAGHREQVRDVYKRQATSILDPAPARALPKEILQLVDIATPNENEACVLVGMPPSRVSADDATALGNKIRELGVRSVIVKLGDQGCVYLSLIQSMDTDKAFAPNLR